jgi:hypothetical protein
MSKERDEMIEAVLSNSMGWQSYDTEGGERVIRALKERRDMRKRRKHEVYFIQAGEHGIKIGYTYRLEKRLRDIQMYCPIKLTVLCSIPGDEGKERELHRKFKHLRIHGEWFRISDEIIEYISSLG